jgi:hypothetical protein
MLDETGDIEEAADLRITQSALKVRSVGITPEFILMNADDPGRFRCPSGSRSFRSDELTARRDVLLSGAQETIF